MSLDKENYSKHFQGFKSTKPLWKDRRFRDIEQFQYTNSINSFNRNLDRRLRLGQLAEQFVFYELETLTDCNILLENFQVLEGKRTSGELDCIVEYLSKILHLELVYKFYLYDKNLGEKEIERWIGPNRSDSLLEKMDKLQQKQFPLLSNKITDSQLSQRNINTALISQKVWW
ncbi:MAG: DUF1853 family protein [Psychroserpens sp.]|nr:DUF1853 family protein [Psychroserpens sp.]